MTRHTFRKNERDLVNCATELTLPNGDKYGAVLSDESRIGCAIHLPGQIEIELGNIVRVLIEKHQQKAIVRRIQVDNEGVVIGLEYQFASSNASVSR